MKVALAACGASLLSVLIGCQSSAPKPTAASPPATQPTPIVTAKPTIPAVDPSTFPPRPLLSPIAAGVERGEVTITSTTGRPMKLWYYRPATDRPLLDRSLPLALIAASGSIQITGCGLSEDDAVDQVRWARAGFAVIAYELDGPLDRDHATSEQIFEAIGRFMDARGGVLNASAALDYVAARLPEIDLSRGVAVGHDSAGNAALLAARDLDRVRAAVAFAPEPDIAGQYSETFRAAIDQQHHGFDAFVQQLSPSRYADQLKKPVFLFVAQDDERVSAAGIQALAEAMRRNGQSPQLIVVPKGGHVEAMETQGVDLAIEWTKRELQGR